MGNLRVGGMRRQPGKFHLVCPWPKPTTHIGKQDVFLVIWDSGKRAQEIQADQSSVRWLKSGMVSAKMACSNMVKFHMWPTC